jgi:hypothetical protein
VVLVMPRKVPPLLPPSSALPPTRNRSRAEVTAPLSPATTKRRNSRRVGDPSTTIRRAVPKFDEAASLCT